MSEIASKVGAIQAARDRAELGELLTQLRAGQPVRDLAARVRDHVGPRDAVSFSTISSWCRGKTVPNPRQFAAFEALLAECGITDTQDWMDAVQRIRGADAAGDSPYPGLAPFGEADSAAFSGRDSLIEQALSCIGQVGRRDGGGAVALVGASGSGKTSLVRAGLVPRLRQDGWEPTIVEITDTPQGAISAMRAATDARSVVFVDRLEQLLRPTIGESARTAFLDALVAPGRASVVVLVMRADFYDTAAAYPALLETLQDAQILIGPMGNDEIRAAIEGPARAAGSTVPEGLIELVCSEAGARDQETSAGLLPHLSYALQQTWNNGRRGRMSIGDYQAVGGLAGAIQQSAEAAYADLPPAAQKAVRQIFLRLVNVSDDGPLTRRFASRDELDAICQTSDDEVDLIEHLVSMRLLVISNDRVEIAHEALLTEWSRLAAWVEEARDALRAYASLSVATATWVEGDRQAADLARGNALDEYSSLSSGSILAITDQEREFVDASTASVREAQNRRRQQVRRLRGLLAGSTVLALLVAIFAAATVVAQRSATKSRDDALSRQVAVTAQGLAEKNPSVAARLALSAYQIAPTFEARSAVLELGSHPVPQRVLGGGGSKALALTSDGELLATSDSVDKTVELLRRNDAGLYLPAGSIDVGFSSYGIAIDSSGTMLAAGGDAATVELWDISDPAAPSKLTGPLTGPDIAVQRLAFSPDGSELSAVGAGKGIYRWDITNPDKPADLPIIPVPSAVTWSLAYSPNGKLLAVTDDDARAHLFARGKTVRRIAKINLKDRPGRTVAFSPDSSRLAIGSIINSFAQVWDVTNAKKPRVIPESEGAFDSWVNDVGFSPDGKYVAGASSDETVKVWRTDTWEQVITLDHSGIVTQLEFAEGGVLASVATDGTTRVWSLPQDLPLNGPGAVFNLSASATTGAVTGTGTGHARLFTPREDGSLDVGAQEIITDETLLGSGTVSPDGTMLTLGHRDGLLEVKLLGEGAPAKPLVLMDDPDFGSVRDVSWSPDSQLLAAIGEGELRFWDVSDPAKPVQTATFTPGTRGSGVAWHPTKRLLAVAYEDGTARLYDATDPNKPVELASLGDSPSELFALAFHPAGEILALSGNEAKVELWDITDPSNPVLTGNPLVGPSSKIQWAAFSPDGTRLGGVSNNGAAWVWDTTEISNPADFAVLGPATTGLGTITFTPNSQHLIAAGVGSVVNDWSINIDEVSDRICSDLGEGLTEEEWATHVRGVDYVDPCQT